MTSQEIRSRFLEFFASRGHRVVRSSSLVPASDDPSMANIFTNAGMNQFKDVFLGLETREYTRACSVQKCARASGKHNDLEQVGRTRRHQTFFEMLGNFSFGDYFKKEAIPWAWELVTKDFGIPKEKLYATVFREDDEAEELWAKIVARDRIFRMDEKDNFWAMGDTGPCGPCSEIHYDMGPEASDLGHQDCKFPCDCGRYVELWNLVFMQFNRDEQGNMTPLPRPSIDTGMGLERTAAALQGKLSNFDTDLFQPLIDEAASFANVEYGANHDTDVSLRIIADHARASTFLISDGVLPSNEGRGYVLRLIMRRALYHGQTLGLNEPFLFKMAGHVVQMMKDAFPELLQTEQHVAKAIKIEEERYEHTTRFGLDQLDKILVGKNLTFAEWKEFYKSPKTRPDFVFKKGDHVLIAEVKTFPGQELFKLHDTFGLRPDFVEDIVKNYGLTIDRAAYDAEMAKQRERARASWKAAEKKVAQPVYQHLAEKGKTVFDGYKQTTSADCRIVALVQPGGDGAAKRSTAVSAVPTGGTPVLQAELIIEANPGAEVEIVLDHTPFYAEAGGQVGDVGHFLAPGSDHEVAHVTDTYYPVSGLIVHKAIARDTLHVGNLVTAQADAERRDSIRRNHTATHLLHAALRTTLGTHVKQAGSLVAPDRLRFDFSHYAALDEQDLLDIEDLVNEHVLKNEAVVTDVTDLDQAVNSGAMALFGEKYGDKVRVVSIADGSFSKELCGGTHVRRTGDIGLFKVVSEASVAAGTRRIEALTGTGVLKQLREASETLKLLSDTLRAKPDELLQAAEKLTEAEKKLRKELEAQQIKRATDRFREFVRRASEVKGVKVVSEFVEVTDRTAMRQMVDTLRSQVGSGVIALGTNTSQGRVALIVAVTEDLTNKLDAGQIVKQAAAFVEGSGGGRKDLAEAGGKNPAKLGESLQAIPSIVEKML